MEKNKVGIVVYDNIIKVDGFYNNVGVSYTNWGVNYINKTKYIHRYSIITVYQRRVEHDKFGISLYKIRYEKK